MSEEVKEKRVKRPKSKARKIIEWVFTGIFLVLFAFVLIGQIDGMAHKKEKAPKSLRAQKRQEQRKAQEAEQGKKK